MKNSESQVTETENFFNRWSIYRTVIRCDYMHHRAMMEVLTQFLAPFPNFLSLLDIGCGDSSIITEVIKAFPDKIISYTGIDLSDEALQLAYKNLTAINIDFSLIQGDMSNCVINLQKKYDIIYSSFAIHHLNNDSKQLLFSNLQQKISCNGVFILHDLMRRSSSENRETYLNRLIDDIQNNWILLSEEEKVQMKSHVLMNDFPEDRQTLIDMVVTSGFKKSKIIFIDSNELYQLVSFS